MDLTSSGEVEIEAFLFLGWFGYFCLLVLHCVFCNVLILCMSWIVKCYWSMDVCMGFWVQNVKLFF